MSLSITSKINKKTALLAITGEVDMFSSPEARKEIANLVKKKVERIVVDLTGVSYMDSSGVATLIEGLQMCHKYNGTLVVAGLRQNVREVFELTKLDKIFKIYNDSETALKE